MEKVGASRRLVAAILDGVFIAILIVVGIVIYSSVRGAQLGMEAQRALGIPVSWNTIGSDEVWSSYERKVEEMASDMEVLVKKEFTEEQATFILNTALNSLEQKFVPDDLTVEFFLDLDESALDRLVDEAFDSVIAAGREDISKTKIDTLREEVKSAMAEFGVGTIVPKVIDFVIWLLLLPVVITLLYGLAEGLSGRSPGKLITGIGIRTADGERAFAGTHLLRYSIKNASFLLMILALLLRSQGVAIAAGIAWVVVAIGVLVMLGPDKRAIYDYIANTAVFQIVPGENRE